MLLKPNPTNNCFGCGGANARGMQLTFEQDDAARRIRGAFRLSSDYQGGTGFVHGGIVATLLDEVMAKVSRFQGDHAVTGELTVEYVKPVPVDRDLLVEGWEVERNGRNLLRQGEIRDASGALLARGKGRFVQIDVEALRRKLGAKETAKH
ncbi:MAG: PaaI family thioesterase [Candidatus Acidiferrales bacterium]